MSTRPNKDFSEKFKNTRNAILNLTWSEHSGSTGTIFYNYQQASKKLANEIRDAQERFIKYDIKTEVQQNHPNVAQAYNQLQEAIYKIPHQGVPNDATIQNLHDAYRKYVNFKSIFDSTFAEKPEFITLDEFKNLEELYSNYSSIESNFARLHNNKCCLAGLCVGLVAGAICCLYLQFAPKE